MYSMCVPWQCGWFYGFVYYNNRDMEGYMWCCICLFVCLCVCLVFFFFINLMYICIKLLELHKNKIMKYTECTKLLLHLDLYYFNTKKLWMNWPCLLCKLFGTSIQCVKGKVALSFQLRCSRWCCKTENWLNDTWMFLPVCHKVVIFKVFESLEQWQHGYIYCRSCTHSWVEQKICCALQGSKLKLAKGKLPPNLT